MGDRPPDAELAGVTPSVFYGLLAAGAADVLDRTFDYAHQKDSALIAVVDATVSAVAEGNRAADGPKPRWLDGLVARELRKAATRRAWGDPFCRVRLLERLGLVTLDADDTYVLAMVGSLGRDKAAKLRADPDLVARALWRVFEVEGGGEVSLTNVDRYGPEPWRPVFLELVADGTLDRERVLTSCLRALGRDFAAYRAGWFSATYLALEPSVEEAARSQVELRRLLGAAVPATVTFAVAQLSRIAEAGLLEVEAALDALPSAAVVRPKGTAVAALALARSVGSAFPGAVQAVARAALGHPNADVQRAAAVLLVELGDLTSVHNAAEDLTPSVRQELGLRLEVLEGPGPVRVPSPAPLPEPVSAADLAERTAALLENAGDAAELEVVLAGLVAPGAGEALRPLAKRARSVAARRPPRELDDGWLPGQVARLVLDVLGDPQPPCAPDGSARLFVVRRLAELRTTTAPLLATPDLSGGWVSAQALVDRLAHNPSPRHHDVVAALLRLHPDGRDDVARTVAALPAAVQFALDGDEPERKGLLRRRRTGPDAWWLAAERSRATYPKGEAPTLHGDIMTSTWTHDGREHRHRYVRFAVTRAGTREPADDLPTELPARAGRASGWELGDWVPSLAAVWPHDAEHFLALTCGPVLEAPVGGEVWHDAPRVLDALARHPGRMGGLAAATLAAGLSSARPDHRLHAVDAFCDLVLPERVGVADVASVLARYAPAWSTTRWAQSLAAVARVPGGGPVAVDLLTHLLPQLPLDQPGLVRLLDVLRDELVRLGRRPSDPALVAWLGTLRGGSGAAATARLLLG